MESDPKNCAICNRPPADGVKMQNSRMLDGLLIECPQCGRYELTGMEAVFQSHEWTTELRGALSCATRQASEAGQRLRIIGANAMEFAGPHTNTRVSDNQERLLREAARRASRPHLGAPFSTANDFTLIDCYSKEEFIWYCLSLVKQDLVALVATGSNDVLLTLSADGWKRVQPLPRLGGIPGRCFVAMRFSDETRSADESGIEPAVRDAGFKAIRIDRKEHNNEIPDEILAEIRNCEFMVADFTGQSAGVYYEAGFAMGLGRKIVWCCRTDEVDKLHFDTNHKNHITWQTPKELRERLYTRIRTTILEQG